MIAAVGSPPARPWVVAHRGASAYAPENTIAAFTLAAEQGATFVELDVQRTKDGALVLLHDTTLERTPAVETVFPDRGRRREAVPVEARAASRGSRRRLVAQGHPHGDGLGQADR